MQELNTLIQAIGPTAAILIWLIWMSMRNKKNGNGSIKKDIQSLKDNHFGEVNNKLDTLIRHAGQSERREEETNKLLIQIVTILRNRR